MRSLKLVIWVSAFALSAYLCVHFYGSGSRQGTPGVVKTVMEHVTTSPLMSSDLPRVAAGSVVLMDVGTGNLLYTENADEPRPPASTTKLMSMLVVLDAVKNGRVSWRTEVPVQSDALAVSSEPGVSDAHFHPEEVSNLDTMMRYIAVLSANDAMVAVADRVAGSQRAFVGLMNEKARQLGLRASHFQNTDGLPASNHVMSARDLATLSRYLLEHYPEILKYTALPSVRVHGVVLPSTDELIGKYPGLDGLKTGYTQSAGYCFVGTAERSGKRLIVVLMGDTNSNQNQRFSDASRLLDYGFHKLGVS